MPADLLAKEREITEAQARDSGKPDNIVEKMVDGRMRKYLSGSRCLARPSSRIPTQPSAKLLQANGATVNGSPVSRLARDREEGRRLP